MALEDYYKSPFESIGTGLLEELGKTFLTTLNVKQMLADEKRKEGEILRQVEQEQYNRKLQKFNIALQLHEAMKGGETDWRAKIMEHNYLVGTGQKEGEYIPEQYYETERKAQVYQKYDISGGGDKGAWKDREKLILDWSNAQQKIMDDIKGTTDLKQYWNQLSPYFQRIQQAKNSAEIEMATEEMRSHLEKQAGEKGTQKYEIFVNIIPQLISSYAFAQKKILEIQSMTLPETPIKPTDVKVDKSSDSKYDKGLKKLERTK